MKEQPIKGWVKEKPDFKKDCLLIVASKIRDQWEHTLFEIKKTDCGEGWYWGAFQDGDEWGDISDIEGHLYKVIPTANDETPVQSGKERWVSVEEKEKLPPDLKPVLVAAKYGNKIVTCNDTAYLKEGHWFDNGNDMQLVEGFIKYHQPLPNPPNGEQKSNAGEERLFTLKEALEIWKAATDWMQTQILDSEHTTSNKQQYFKEKFNIDLK